MDTHTHIVYNNQGARQGGDINREEIKKVKNKGGRRQKDEDDRQKKIKVSRLLGI